MLHLRPKTELRIAVPFVLIASLFGAATGAVAKFASSTVSTEMMVFGRMFLSMITITLWIEFTRPSSWKEKLHTREWGVHLVRGLCGLAGLSLYYYSLKFLDLTDATLLQNTMPIFVPLVAYAWRRIPLSHNIFWGIGIAFVGIIFVLEPGKGVFQPASIWALLSGISGAIASVALRFAHYTEPVERTLFYYFLVGMVISAFVVLTHAESNFASLNPQTLLYLLLIGAFGVAFQIFYTLASKHAPVRLISGFLYVSVIFSMLFDWWFWDRIISWYTIFGFSLIVLGALLMIYLFPKETS